MNSTLNFKVSLSGEGETVEVNYRYELKGRDLIKDWDWEIIDLLGIEAMTRLEEAVAGQERNKNIQNDNQPNSTKTSKVD